MGLEDRHAAQARRRPLSDGPEPMVAGDDTEGRAPICAACGVTALPSETGEGFVCEHPDCPAYGDPV